MDTNPTQQEMNVWRKHTRGLSLMKILAIGATGFVGSRVTRQLTAQGYQVALFHRGSTTASDLDSIAHFYGTRHQLPNFKAEFEPFAPDVILDIIPCRADVPSKGNPLE
jgi:nucleoside-diphosphate-sugar epimerase